MNRRRNTQWMDHGINCEPEAVASFLRQVRDMHGNLIELEEIDFVTSNDERLGCSPDRVVKVGAGNSPREAVEIKCPAPWTMAYYLKYGLEDDYTAQVQGQLYVGEYDLCHFYAYYPGWPPFYRATPRRDGYIDKLHIYLSTFVAELDEYEREIRNMPGWPEYTP